MNDLITRIRTVLTAINTWLVVTAAILMIGVEELGGIAGLDPVVVEVIGTVLSVVVVAAAIVRRSAEALPDARGLLPPPPNQPVTEREADLIDQYGPKRS